MNQNPEQITRDNIDRRLQAAGGGQDVSKLKRGCQQPTAAVCLRKHRHRDTLLRLMKEHVISSVHLEREDLDYAPFDAKGGIGKMHQLFGEEMDVMIDEFNEAMAA